jgi:hypothetical protein
MVLTRLGVRPLVARHPDPNERVFSMFRQAVLAAALAVSGGQAMAELQPLPGNFWTQGGVVTVSCFRGPFTVTAWDHPEAIFVESLVAVGYDYPSAFAIGERICKDSTLVGNPDGLKAAMEQIIAEAPR